jgi:acetyl esterase/lipase
MITRRTLIAAAALAPMAAAPLAPPLLAAVQEGASDAADAVEKRWNLVYGETAGEELLLNAFLPPPRDDQRPAVILIHGGSWSFGSRSDMGGAGQELAKRGYVALSIDYRLLDGNADHAWPAQLDDVQRAVRWVRANAGEFNVDPERIAAYGYSAGAHLAMMLGLRETRDDTDPDLTEFSSRVQCVVSLGGDMDLTVLQTDYSFKVTLEQFLGGTAEERPDAYRDASPVSWVDNAAAPSLIAHGGFDDLILAEQSRRMVAALTEAGVEVVYVVIPRVGHDGIGQWALMSPLALAFLGMHLQPDR